MMGLRGILLQQQLLLWAIILAAFAASEPDPSCNRTCGSLNIPYPFGKSESCYLDPSFLINCSDSTPFLGEGNLEVLNISLDGELRISSPIARSCPKDPRYTANDSITRLQGLNFLISPTRNKFTTVGCDTLAVIVGTLGVAEEDYATSCVSLCNRTDSVVNGSCDGIGCCQASIRGGMSSFAVSVGSINNHSEVFRFNPCSFGFVAEQAAYNFSSLDLANLQNRVTLPLVLDWAVGNQTCQDAKKNLTSYACKAENSICSNSINGPGYRCNCSSGYQGNPYLSDGCQDIDECAISNPCTKKCTNILGSYICDDCPKGYQGDGRTNGTGCSPILTRSRTTTIVIELVVLCGVGCCGGFICGLRFRCCS